MNQHMLINYGIIRSFHDSGKSVIDTLMPFVEYGLSQTSKLGHDHYDKASLKQIILDETGISIKDLTLSNLLKKLERKNIIQLFDHNQYFRIKQSQKIHISEYLDNIDSSKRKLNKFIAKYREYSKDERDDTLLKDFLFEVIKCKHLKYGIAADQDVPDLSKYDTMFSFIEYIQYQDDELFKIFQDINFGYTLCSLVEKEEQIDKIKLKDFIIYLDSNFILRLLDLQEECYSNETKELFDLLSQSGAKLKVFEETLIEVISVIEFYKQRYIHEKDEVNSIVQASNINGVYGAFYRRGLTITQIDDIVDNLYEDVERLGIDKDSTARYKLICDEKEAEKLYERKYGESEHKEDDYRFNKCKNYITIIKIIKWLRNASRVRATCFGNSRYVFLTCDWKLYRYNLNGRTARVDYPEIIIQESIVDNLMLFFPEGYEKISTELILSIYQSSQYLNVYDLNTFADNIKTIIKDDPSMTSYIIKVTKNIENYDDIARLYSDGTQDPIEGLKTLIDEQRKKDDSEEEQEKIAQDAKLSEKYEAGKQEGFECGEQSGFAKGKQQGYEDGEKTGLAKGKASGVVEGEERILRQLAKQQFRKKNIIKIIGLLALFIVPTVFAVLILTNVIDVSKININETAKWIVSTLMTVAFWSAPILLAKKINFTEQDEYEKLVIKYKKEGRK